MAGTVAIVGCGLVGRAWSIAFARAGWETRLWDPIEGAVGACLGMIDELLADLEAQQLLDEPRAAVRARYRPMPDLEAALADVAWVQESAPERVEVKRELWGRMDKAAPPKAILASSTSAIVPSRFTEELAGRERCVIAHPLNPPYLIPAIELVPAPWTSTAVMERAEAIMRGIGQAPIMMRKEIDGFVMNRLQAALVEEAFKLVAEGYCGAEDIDIGLKQGLALRWCFMGPFETGDLNAPGGIRDYVTRYRSVFDGICETGLPRPDWTGPVIDRIEAERTEHLPRDVEANRARQRWRDRRLMALAAHKRKAAAEIGE